jgi:phosphoglycolate phosphatase-like HAD superfamily hydrolase
MKTVVLFDIDGTLLASGGVGRRAFEKELGARIGVLGARGAPGYRYDGKTDRQIARELMRQAGHDDGAIDAMIEPLIADYLVRLREELDEGAPGLRVHAGIFPLLDALEARDDVVLGLLTGNVVGGAALKLGAAGIAPQRFVVGAYGSDHEHRPELPAIAQRRAAALLGCDVPGRAIVIIGDTPADVECGRGIGARAIGVATGHFSVDDLASHDPYAVFPDLSDLDAVLEAICNA